MAIPGSVPSSSDLLELSASDDVSAFVTSVEKEGRPVDDVSVWYCRRIGSKEMGFEERTPLMIAAMFGSKKVVKYILEKGGIDVNRASGSDGATALHCAISGGSAAVEEVVRLLIESSADVDVVDANGRRPLDLVGLLKNSNNSGLKVMMMMLNGGICVDFGENDDLDSNEIRKKEYPIDLSLPDIKNGIYGSDEFRMYTFKIKPCSRAYSHDWTECPFVHPGENARRRDPRKYHYSCVPCPDFRRNACLRGDSCEYAHGIFECWLHPAQYRTRLCKDETSCTRRVCFFAHKIEELRPLYASTGSAVPSPRSMSPLTPPMSPSGAVATSPGSGSWPNQSIFAPPALNLPGSRLKTALNARDQWPNQFVDDLSWLSSPTPWNDNSGSNLLDSAIIAQLRMNQVRAPPSVSSGLMNDPIQSPSSARAAAFAKRSQSFIDRGSVNRNSMMMMMPSPLPVSDWGSPDGKLDWGIQKEDMNKLRKSASFGFRSNGSPFAATSSPSASSYSPGSFDEEEEKHLQFLRNNGGGGGAEILASWMDQFYLE